MPIDQDMSVPPPLPVRYSWYQKAAGILYAIFCFEIGVFLLVLPWSRYWDYNYLASLANWKDFWASDYLRGAVSGLGIINLYLSLHEVFALRRFAAGDDQDPT